MTRAASHATPPDDHSPAHTRRHSCPPRLHPPAAQGIARGRWPPAAWPGLSKPRAPAHNSTRCWSPPTPKRLPTSAIASASPSSSPRRTCPAAPTASTPSHNSSTPMSTSTSRETSRCCVRNTLPRCCARSRNHTLTSPPSKLSARRRILPTPTRSRWSPLPTAALSTSPAPPSPYHRDAADPVPQYWKHIGLYAYRKSALNLFPTLPASALERAERLEQLRFLENGLLIYVETHRTRHHRRRHRSRSAPCRSPSPRPAQPEPVHAFDRTAL